MLNNKILIFDFDSTFIQVETLDVLAELVLKHDNEKSKKLKKISDVTNAAMNGEIDFPTALKNRPQILSMTKMDIENITQKISKMVSKSIKNNQDFFLSNAEKIWIVSGGFKEIIVPIVKEFGIPSERVLANTFIYDSDIVAGCDESNNLFMDKGKILAIESHEISGKKFMIGDGYTDYEVFENGTADHFIYFSENVCRDSVRKLTDLQATSFEDVLQIIEKL
jgi:D-3-phosphoglycerate dehydrogenase